MTTMSYRSLLRRDGARPLALASALGWLAFGGYGFAVILSVRQSTGSFADAGAVSAVFAIGVAALAPLRGRAIDRRGGPALAAFALAHGIAGAGLVITLGTSGSDWPLWPAAALTGACAPPLVATARSLWTRVAGPQLARSAHALNAAMSDVAVIAGPALVAGVSALWAPAAALGILIAAAVIASWLVAWLAWRDRPTGEVPARGPARDRLGPLRHSRGLRTLVLVELPLGAWLGGLDIAVTAVAADHGAAALGAIPLAAAGAGSVVASIATGTHRVTASAGRRYLAGSVVSLVALPLTLIDPAVWSVALVLVLVGAGFGLLNVASFELIDHVVAEGSRTEAFTWLTSANAAGAAVGAAVAGRLAVSSPSAALALVTGLAGLVVVVVVSRGGSLRAAGSP
jgi:predicted MFS family arabinose efflux permease